MTLAIDKVDGCGLTNTVRRHAHLVCKEDKVDAGLDRRKAYKLSSSNKTECLSALTHCGAVKGGNRLQLHCNNLTFYYC